MDGKGPVITGTAPGSARGRVFSPWVWELRRNNVVTRKGPFRPPVAQEPGPDLRRAAGGSPPAAQTHPLQPIISPTTFPKSSCTFRRPSLAETVLVTGFAFRGAGYQASGTFSLRIAA